ncbi:molybdopterin-guanine dinucleotide biosynthesis protein B [Companilactobacillus mishanensis]|uniref:molybdopterin-guanine dinucleotide biosynthesis protein B n=1 Tax=Companilactobacillus mishanensis TaxID=2486008 RepID=UPI001294DD14|nr:molybdopterin-guanine dinucleotide biosynthesis protein B [Companilactobacillus mishanensis]MQS89965.1 molybdopterin-guanine dinucleotide biosynthesis protein B [Companilactobacillus mishanensis]
MVTTFQIIGHKKSGKTTLTNDFLKFGKAAGYSFSVVKHTHGPVDIPANTDTGKFYQQSDDVLLLNDSQTIHYQRKIAKTASEQITELQKNSPADFLIIEGLKELDYPKITLLKEDEVKSDFADISQILIFASIQKDESNIISLMDTDERKKFIINFLREIQ